MKTSWENIHIQKKVQKYDKDNSQISYVYFTQLKNCNS